MFAVGIYGVAFLLLCAGLSHADGPESLRDSEYRREHHDESRVRLTVMAMGLVAPVASISLIAPMSRVDAAIRTTAMLGLVAALVVRLSIAQQDHNRARLALLERVNRDDLTGLPTRTRFVTCVAEVLETTWRSEQRPTIIQLNIDRFKNINDSLGHYDANRVLVSVAERLTRDRCVVRRDRRPGGR